MDYSKSISNGTFSFVAVVIIFLTKCLTLFGFIFRTFHAQSIMDYYHHGGFHVAPRENTVQPHHSRLYQVSLDLLGSCNPKLARN